MLSSIRCDAQPGVGVSFLCYLSLCPSSPCWDLLPSLSIARFLSRQPPHIVSLHPPGFSLGPQPPLFPQLVIKKIS